MTTKLKTGLTESHHTNSMLAIKWKDHRDIIMLTTQYEDKMISSGKQDHQGNSIIKPLSVLKYNKYMGAIDKTDMLLCSVECVRRTVKWYKKLFFHLIDLSLLNAYSAYKTCTGIKISLADFQYQLIREIFTKYGSPKLDIQKKGRRSENVELPHRLLGNHYPSIVPPTPSRAKPQRKYIVC